MDKKEEKNLIRRKVYAFKKIWLNITKKKATPKILVYYRRGLRKRIEEEEKRHPCIVGERFFIDAMKMDHKNFPTPEDLEECQSAFNKGYGTDPK